MCTLSSSSPLYTLTAFAGVSVPLRCLALLSFAEPPVFFPGTRSVNELSPANTHAGAPMNATVESSSIVVLYIDQGTGNATQFFSIGACDGQIRVKASNTIDHDARYLHALAELWAITSDVGVSCSQLPALPYLLFCFS